MVNFGAWVCLYVTAEACLANVSTEPLREENLPPSESRPLKVWGQPPDDHCVLWPPFTLRPPASRVAFLVGVSRAQRLRLQDILARKQQVKCAVWPVLLISSRPLLLVVNTAARKPRPEPWAFCNGPGWTSCGPPS